jgi:hypothetical protein
LFSNSISAALKGVSSSYLRICDLRTTSNKTTASQHTNGTREEMIVATGNNGRGISSHPSSLYAILRTLVIAPAWIIGCYSLFLIGGLLLPLLDGGGGGIASSQPRPWDSSKSAVLAMATNMHLGEYQAFVGSLRSTGYSGRIILGISPDASSEVVDYLEANMVTIRRYAKADRCTYDGYTSNEGKALDMNHPPSRHPWQCPVEYPDYKMTHARFVLYRDWIAECPDCTDGIMLTDARDAYFQAGEVFCFSFFSRGARSLVFYLRG